MVKTPHTRHSKSTRQPVTIDLAPGEVSRTKADAEQQSAPATTAAAETGTDQTSQADTALDAGKSASAAAPSPEAEKPELKSAGSTKPTATSTAGGGGSGPAGTSGGTHAFGRAETASSTPPPAAGKPRGSVVPGALAGGVVALLVAGGLSYTGLLPASQTSAPPVEDTAGPAIAALEREMATLREQIAALPADGGGAADAQERLTALEQRVDGVAAEIETVRSEVGEAVPPEAGQPFDAGPLEQRLAALEGGFTDLRDRGVDEASVAALRDELASVREAQSAAESRVTRLEQSLSELTTTVEEAAQSPVTAIIIAASSLKAAIDRGTPFMTELETYASLKPEAAEIAELRDMAATGVPTRAQIAAESDAAVNAMIAAARPVDPEAGVFDRLAASAMGLVQVRPVGMVEGAGVPETGARIDAAVQAGDYSHAITEFETLPPEAKTAGEAFITKVKARAAADRLVDEALAAALQK